MLSRGKNLQLHLTSMQNDVMASLYAMPTTLRHSFLPYFLISMPLWLVSNLLVWLVPLVTACTLFVLYAYAKQDEALLYEVKQPRTHVAYIAPYSAFTSIWGFTILVNGLQYVLPFVSVYIVLLGVIIRPTLWKKPRLLDLDFVFIALGTLSIFVLIWSFSWKTV